MLNCWISSSRWRTIFNRGQSPPTPSHKVLNTRYVCSLRSGITNSYSTSRCWCYEYQGILQQKLSQKIDELEVDISTKVQSLQEKYPFVHGVIAELTDAAAQLQDVENEIRGITDELRHQTWLTSKHYATIGHLAQEQKFGDDPPKVGTTLCFSIIMQNDIDSGQAQTVSRLYRKMCDKYIQFGEGQLLVPIEDASGDEPYILGQHVVQLDLSMPSSHAENWEKLNSALSYIMANLFQFDFFLKVDPDTYFFSGNYNYFMAYMARKWGNRFYQEPLYAGLPLHHNAPAYNSGHVYILNRESMSLVVSALTESRRVFGKEGRAAAKEHTLTCAWSNPHENKFLAGCAHGCKAVATLDEAMSFCELLPGCGGVVDLGEAADSQRFQLRASTRPEDSAFGETSYVMSCTDENVIPEKEDSASQCAFSLRVPEDLQLGHCLYSLGVRPWDTRDNRGREFLSFTDPKTWSQGFATVMTVPWYYRGRYFDNYGTLSKHLADRIVSIHVGYDPTLLECWPQIYDAVISMEPGSDGGRKTISTTGAIGEWFDNHRYEIVGTGVCSTK